MNVTCFSGGRNPCCQSLFCDIAIDFFPLWWGTGMAPEGLCPAGPPALISPGYLAARWGPAGGITPLHESWHPCVWSQLNSNCKKHPTKSHRVRNRVVWAPVAIATMAKKALGNPGWSLAGCDIACRLPRWEMQGDPWAPTDPLVVQEHLLEGTGVRIWESHVFHMLHFSFSELIMQ